MSESQTSESETGPLDAAVSDAADTDAANTDIVGADAAVGDAADTDAANTDAAEDHPAAVYETAEEIPPHLRSRLVLSRIHHYRDTIRSYQVQIDGQFIGNVRDSKTKTFTLRPGTYEMRLKLLWIHSPKVEVVLAPAGETHMVCGPNGGIWEAWRLFLAPTTAILLRHDVAPDGQLDGQNDHVVDQTDGTSHP